VLVFPEQSLDDDGLLALGHRFGHIEPPRYHRVERRLKHAELADISNLDASNQLRARGDHRRLDALGNQLWHSDASFRQASGALSMLFAHVVPPVGGETEFADLRAALPPAHHRLVRAHPGSKRKTLYMGLHGRARIAHRRLAGAGRTAAAARPDGARDRARVRLPAQLACG